MKILMSAFACEPAFGSEFGAGWAYASAASREHEVWLITHEACRPQIEAALDADPALASNLHPVYLSGPRWTARHWHRGVFRFPFYLYWQTVLCRRAARRLAATIRFDLAHHVTFAADWQPVGISGTTAPLIWGPVGGTSKGGPRLWALLGPRAAVVHGLRVSLLSTARSLVGRAVARRSSLVVAQNPDVAAAFAEVAPVVVEPNVVIEADQSVERRPDTSAPPVAVFAGRLVPWKGLRLALAALRRPAARHWHLHVYGDGPERERLERTAARWGVAERVTFFGRRPRTEVRAAMARASVMLYPSLRDGAPWSVAEALAAGCPVVALGIGGPAALVGDGDGVLVPPHGDVVGGLAAALDRAHGMQPMTDRWTGDRMPDLVQRLYTAAIENSVARPSSRRDRFPAVTGTGTAREGVTP